MTVNLSASSAYIEVYLTEYSGVNQTNPIDAQAGASGSAGAVSSGNATTTVAGDLIYGYCVGDGSCTAGSGFAARSTFDGNLIEDATAGNPGTYAATGTATSGWTMQMVALKPASSGTGRRSRRQSFPQQPHFRQPSRGRHQRGSDHNAEQYRQRGLDASPASRSRARIPATLPRPIRAEAP